MIEIIQGSLTAIGSTIGIIKQIKTLVPESPETTDLEAQLEQLKHQVELNNTQVARELGFQLCYCTNPPQIMLYKKQLDADVCPNLECLSSIERPRVSITSFGPEY